MIPRERVVAALAHQELDKVPLDVNSALNTCFHAPQAEGYIGPYRAGRTHKSYRSLPNAWGNRRGFAKSFGY